MLLLLIWFKFYFVILGTELVSKGENVTGPSQAYFWCNFATIPSALVATVVSDCIAKLVSFGSSLSVIKSYILHKQAFFYFNPGQVLFTLLLGQSSVASQL